MNQKNVEMFRSYMVAKKMSIGTINAYIDDVNHFHSFVCKDDSEIVLSDIVMWQSSIAHLSSATIHRRVSAVKKYFKTLKTLGIISVDPSVGVENVSIKNKETYYKSYDEVVSLINYGKNLRDKAILAVYISTGLRASEVINMTLAQYKSNNIVLKTKGDKERVVTLSDDCKKYIDEYIKVRKDGCDNLFVSNQGTPMKENVLNKTIKVIAERAGFEDGIHLHSLRHSFVTKIAEEYGIETARVVVGHSNIATTQRYVHTNKEKVRDIMASMSL